jgi:hypothetical protein
MLNQDALPECMATISDSINNTKKLRALFRSRERIPEARRAQGNCRFQVSSRSAMPLREGSTITLARWARAGLFANLKGRVRLREALCFPT